MSSTATPDSKKRLLLKNRKSSIVTCTCSSPVAISPAAPVLNIRSPRWQLLTKGSQFLHSLFRDSPRSSLKSTQSQTNRLKNFHLGGFPTNCSKLIMNHKEDKVFCESQKQNLWKKHNKSENKAQKGEEEAQTSFKSRTTWWTEAPTEWMKNLTEWTSHWL